MTFIDRASLQVLDALHQRMQGLFAEVLQAQCESTLWVGSTDLTWATKVTVQETETNLTVLVNLPGIEADELEVEVTQETAVIRYRPSIASASLGLGQFQNIIPFPVSTHPEAVRVEFERNCLMLVLPKAATTQRQSVRVAVGDRSRAAHSPSLSQMGRPVQDLSSHSVLRPS